MTSRLLRIWWGEGDIPPPLLIQKLYVQHIYKHLNITTMLYTHFIGRIGKDAQVINGSKGDFISMDVAVSDYYKGNETTTWVRVRSNRHVNISQWLTKGKLILVEGVLSKPAIWVDKTGTEHVQLSAMADNIHFVRVGRKKDGKQDDGKDKGNVQEILSPQKPDDSDPLGAPVDDMDDLPY